ncbi:MAG: hypothetical protein M0Q13_07090 [Methanothrix sp.]|jgi:hypothetical protein|nr:hypothetical protein [Methanothrix sp.]
MNNWSKAIEFFNSHLRFTREQYFIYMNNKTNRLCTLDTYKNNLERAGFLITVDRGMYKRVKKIPFDLTINRCLKIIKEKEENNRKIAMNIAHNEEIKENKRIELKKKMLNSSFVAIKRLEAINV